MKGNWLNRKTEPTKGSSAIYSCNAFSLCEMKEVFIGTETTPPRDSEALDERSVSSQIQRALTDGGLK